MSRRVTERQLRAALRKGRAIRPREGAELKIRSELLRQVLLDRSTELDPRGLRLLRTRVTGPLDLSLSTLPQLEMIECFFEGPINLEGAKIQGKLTLQGSEIAGVDEDGYSLRATGIVVQGSLVISDTQQAPPFVTRGAVRLSAAQIEGHCFVRGAQIMGSTGEVGFGLLADLISTKGPFYAEDVITTGSISIVSANIGDQLSLSRVDIRGVTGEGCGIQADALTLQGPLYAIGSRVAGGISLVSARLGAELVLRDSDILGVGKYGMSLTASSAHISGEVLLSELRTAGGIYWRGARLDRVLHIESVKLGYISNPLIDLTDAHLDRLFLDDSAGPDCALRLDRTTVRLLELRSSIDQLPKPDSFSSWTVSSLLGKVADDRKKLISWLGDAPQGPQPWYEIANYFDLVGRPSDGRQLRYLAERRATRQARVSREYATWMGRGLYGITTGHGFYPLVSILWLALVAAMSTILAYYNANDFAVSIESDIGSYIAGSTTPKLLGWKVSAAQCSAILGPYHCFDPLRFGISTAFPAVNLQQAWAPPEYLTYLVGALRAVAWILTALFLAGVTRLLRRNG